MDRRTFVYNAALGTLHVGLGGLGAGVLRAQSPSALDSLKTWKYNSPRGPISIDPATRDIVMNEYLVEVVKGKDGKLHQKQLGKIDNVKDPCKEQKIGPCAPKS